VPLTYSRLSAAGNSPTHHVIIYAIDSGWMSKPLIDNSHPEKCFLPGLLTIAAGPFRCFSAVCHVTRNNPVGLQSLHAMILRWLQGGFELS
jgi:hypothetical protein